ncbi:DUF1642 domain-containing protein [Streptococcus oralis]|jgi:hypothetical protein|uniref:DUF1642 domain-containing protein n=1 Tax=Streptococcus oralis TaxID=1303 RepID=UPI0020012B24|nr:DUF1642 domain-containing protein [Streptococcus oralis]DAN58269.1 MAG TPA: Protein of unknown function (DUF1642) [Caudoviricetes sp.]
MNIQGLIERYEKFKASKKKMTSVNLVLKDLRSLDEPEPLPFKLKDVVRRIRGFDPTTQTRWLNDILKELGDDYGSMKYRKGYEQGKLEGAWVGNQLKDADKIRQELNKPVIPQFVADWIEVCKEHLTSSLYLAMTPSFLKSNNQGIELTLWIKKNEETFARAWLDGYEVEKEKLYFVKITAAEQYLVRVEDENFLGFLQSRLKSKFTRKQLEETGFGWVFSCEGIEVEEVTD